MEKTKNMVMSHHQNAGLISQFTDCW